MLAHPGWPRQTIFPPPAVDQNKPNPLFWPLETYNNTKLAPTDCSCSNATPLPLVRAPLPAHNPATRQHPLDYHHWPTVSRFFRFVQLAKCSQRPQCSLPSAHSQLTQLIWTFPLVRCIDTHTHIPYTLPRPSLTPFRHTVAPNNSPGPASAPNTHLTPRPLL